MSAPCPQDLILDEAGNVVDLTKDPTSEHKKKTVQEISIASDGEEADDGLDEESDGRLEAGPEVVDEGEASLAAAASVAAAAKRAAANRNAFQKALACKHSTQFLDSMEADGTAIPQARKKRSSGDRHGVDDGGAPSPPKTARGGELATSTKQQRRRAHKIRTTSRPTAS